MSLNFFETFDDKRGQMGAGGALYVKTPGEALYSLALPLEGVPMVVGAPESVEVDITTSPTKGKIEGKIVLEEKETNFLAHRDNFLRLNDLVGKELNFLAVNSDFTGWKYTGAVSYRQEDIASGDGSKGTIKIVPVSADTTPISDIRALLMPTAKFASAVPAIVDLETATGVETIIFETSPSDAILAVETDQTGGFTAAFGTAGDTKKLTITGTSVGATIKYGIVTVTASKTGYASWKTTIAVSVPGAGA